MSPLTREWHSLARAIVSPIDPRDQFFAAETTDTRVSFRRRAVVGAVVDGRPGKPGAILVSLTSDGHSQQLGVSSVEHARAVVHALEAAWPELLERSPRSGGPT